MTLKEILASNNIGVNELAEKTGLGQATISELVNGKRKEPKLSTATKICGALGIELSELSSILEERRDT